MFFPDLQSTLFGKVIWEIGWTATRLDNVMFGSTTVAWLAVGLGLLLTIASSGASISLVVAAHTFCENCRRYHQKIKSEILLTQRRRIAAMIDTRDFGQLCEIATHRSDHYGEHTLWNLTTVQSAVLACSQQPRSVPA